MTRRRIIVVGAGTAGCVLARRLCSNTQNRVMLFDEGTWLRRPDLGGDPLTIASLEGAFSSATSRRWNARIGSGHSVDLIGGRVIGGSGRINGGYFVHPTVRDLRAWASIAGDRFSPMAFGSAMRVAESDFDFGDQQGRGTAGPLTIERDLDLHPISAAFRDSATDLGYRTHHDLNDGGLVGIGAIPFNSKQGIRVDPSIAYLWPALPRPNLTIFNSVSVVRVAIRDSRAVGVIVRNPGSPAPEVLIEADDIVLCAGTICSPSLLLSSGIGPSGDLRRRGIEIHADLRAVGSHFWNHPTVDIPYLPRPEVMEALSTEVATSGRARSFMQMALHTAKSDGHGCDAEFMATRVPYGVATGLDPSDEMLSLRITNVGCDVTGSIRLSRQEPSGVRINHPFAESSSARSDLRRATRLGMELMSQDKFKELISGRFGPTTRELRSNDRLDSWIDGQLGTAFHMIGSCPMGADPRTSVVDNRFRVHGIDGLRVVDASVIPVQLSRGPAAAVVGLAEIAAQEMGVSPITPPNLLAGRKI